MRTTAKRLWLMGAVALGLVVLVVLFALTTAGGMFGTGRMTGPGGMMGGGFSPMMWGWMLLPVLFWLGLISLLVWAIVWILPTRPVRDVAEETLRERLARGEIETEEYERTLRTLRGDVSVSEERMAEPPGEPENRARGFA